MSKFRKIELVALIIFSLNLVSCATTPEHNHKKSINPIDGTLRFYQTYISPVDGQRCRMYPSCSEYSRIAFQKHGVLKGWIMTCDRLLRCGRDERHVSSPIIKNMTKYCNDPVGNNDFWWYSDEDASGGM